MKLALLGSIAALTIPAFSADSANAYDAMRVVGKQKGEGILETITEVRGSKGTPQPALWKICTSNTSYDVRGSKIISTSAGRALTPLNLSELKLDSDGAHTVAEREAKKSGFEYDYADYSLRTGTKSTPVWEVRLIDERSRRVATLNIGADTGKIVSSLGLNGGTALTKTTATDRPSDGPVAKPGKPQQPGYVQQDPVDYERADDSRPLPKRKVAPARNDAESDESEASLNDESYQNPRYEKVVDRVAEHLKLRGRQFHSWFERNVRPGGTPTYSGSKNNRDYYEEDRPAPRKPERRVSEPSPNETRYYRPQPGERLRD